MKHHTLIVLSCVALVSACATPCEDDLCRQQRAIFLQNYLNQSARPAPEPYYQVVQPVPMQAPQPILSGAGAIASWTGRQWSVTTVTNQQAISCEYRYGSQVFTKLFPSSCPSSISVQ